MNKTLIAAVIVVALAPVGASAQERVGDAALGAASGLILGPVGVVAGAVVGYTVGPNIASAWGMRRSQRVHRTTHYARRTPRSSTVAPGPNQQFASVPEQAPEAAPAAAPAPGPAPVPAQSFE
jgi:phage tail tape-measure protein